MKQNMDHLNYHHLRYFREVALHGNLTRTAERLNLSQSALSHQIRQLEDRLGHLLFERVGRRLELTEVGRITLDHANRIFETGADLMATLRQEGRAIPPLRIGAQSTLSRNFQIRFLQPALHHATVEIVLRSGQEASLLDALTALSLDVVLMTDPPRDTARTDLVAHRLAEQPVALHAVPGLAGSDDLPGLLRHRGFIVPTDPTIRAGFLALCDRYDATPRIVADVDDMAMVRLLARAGAGLALAPAVVVADELTNGRLITLPFDLGITESFYAVTLKRRFPHPLLAELIAAARDS